MRILGTVYQPLSFAPPLFMIYAQWLQNYCAVHLNSNNSDTLISLICNIWQNRHNLDYSNLLSKPPKDVILRYFNEKYPKPSVFSISQLLLSQMSNLPIDMSEIE